MKMFLLLLVFAACVDAQGPNLARRPEYIMDCMDHPDYPDCQPLVVYVWAEPMPPTQPVLPDSLYLHAWAPGADRLTAALTFEGPGAITFAYSIVGDRLDITASQSALSTRILWYVVATRGSVVTTSTIIWDCR